MAVRAHQIIWHVLTLTLASCAAAPTARIMSIKECERSEVCTVRGLLEMSNDGHAYIGKIHIDGGGCVNVSLPEAESRRRSGQPMQMITVTGKVFPYVYENTLIEYRINNRKIGYGLCGDYFVFAK